MQRDHSSVLAITLGRFRRRLRVIAFVRYVTVAIAIALGLVDMVMVTRSADSVALVFATSILLATIAAFGFAVLRTPSLAATAAIVDRSCGLQDRTRSAWEFSTAHDPMSRLLVTDAAAHLEAVPAHRLALDVPAWATALIVLACATTALLFLPAVRSASSTTSMVDSSSRSTGRPGSTIANGERRGGQGLERTTTPDAGNTVADNQGTAPRAEPSSASNDASDAAGRRENGAADRGAEADRTNATTRDVARSQDPGASPTTPSPGAASRGGSEAAPREGARGPAVPSSAASASAPGFTAHAQASNTTAHGGINSGALAQSASQNATVSSPPDARRTAAYAAAYDRAESATPIEHVPAAYRAYVRAYFLAVRPGQ